MAKIKYSEMIKNRELNDFNNFCEICGKELTINDKNFCYECEGTNYAEGIMYKK